MRRLGWGLFSLALGIAVTVSGVHGLLPAEIAWAAVALGVGLLIAAGIHGHRVAIRPRRRKKPRPQPLDIALRRLGREILEFLHARDLDSPGWTSSETSFRQPVRAARLWRMIRAYEQDTMAVYSEQFSERVRRLVYEVVDREIGRKEAYRLIFPRDVAAAESAARRLIEIGERVRSRGKRKVA